jgi:Na+/H+-dicarboxylate symporter
MKKALSVIMLLSGIMPLFLGLTCLISFPKALDLLKLSDSSSDVFQAVTLFGICLLPLGILQLVAGYWIWKGKSTGILLAQFIGAMLLLTGVLIFVILKRPDLAVGDLLKGIIITSLALLIRRRGKAEVF